MSLNKTSIEYLTHTWNPVAMRCSWVSEGCQNCWHLRYADRLAVNPKILSVDQKAYSGGEPVLSNIRMIAPYRRKKPAIIGVQFMGDLFNKIIPFWMINTIFESMVTCPHHRFLILTKNPERMYQWADSTNAHQEQIHPHLWLGVSVENQQRADERIPILLQIPATVRFISIEPMLGPIDLKISPAHINWVIMGCESGPKVRPMKYKWAQNVLKQCIQTGTPLFYKQGPDDYNRIVKMPQLGGKIWDQMPKGMSKC